MVCSMTSQKSITDKYYILYIDIIYYYLRFVFTGCEEKVPSISIGLSSSTGWIMIELTFCVVPSPTNN